jgi:hypothetical protein
MLSRSPPHLQVLVSSAALGLTSAALTQASSINPYLLLLTSTRQKTTLLSQDPSCIRECSAQPNILPAASSTIS